MRLSKSDYVLINLQGQKNLNSSLSFGQAVLNIACPQATFCLYKLMILFDDELLEPCPFGKRSLKFTCTAEMHMSLTTGWKFFECDSSYLLF